MKNPQAVLILNPSLNYLSQEVYCCFVNKLGLKPDVNVVSYLNQNFSSFVDAVNLIAEGEIEDLYRMTYNNQRIRTSFPSLKKAKEMLKLSGCNDLYYYDMSEKKYKWIKLEDRFTPDRTINR